MCHECASGNTLPKEQGIRLGDYSSYFSLRSFGCPGGGGMVRLSKGELCPQVYRSEHLFCQLVTHPVHLSNVSFDAVVRVFDGPGASGTRQPADVEATEYIVLYVVIIVVQIEHFVVAGHRAGERLLQSFIVNVVFPIAGVRASCDVVGDGFDLSLNGIRIEFQPTAILRPKLNPSLTGKRRQFTVRGKL